MGLGQRSSPHKFNPAALVKKDVVLILKNGREVAGKVKRYFEECLLVECKTELPNWLVQLDLIDLVNFGEKEVKYTRKTYAEGPAN